LSVTLDAACAAFDRQSFGAGTNELMAFQNKLQAQVVPDVPALADILSDAAQQIMSVLNAAPRKGKLRMLRADSRTAALLISAPLGQKYRLQVSSDVKHWQTVVSSSGQITPLVLEEPMYQQESVKFYRLILP